MNTILIAMAAGAATAGVSLLGLALFALRQARRARRDAQRLDERLCASVAQVANLAEQLAAGQRHHEEMAAQVGQLRLQLGRVDGPALRLGLREAVALSRRGADVQEIVATCGIGYGEARLIGMLHGRSQAATAEPELN